MFTLDYHFVPCRFGSYSNYRISVWTMYTKSNWHASNCFKFFNQLNYWCIFQSNQLYPARSTDPLRSDSKLFSLNIWRSEFDLDMKTFFINDLKKIIVDIKLVQYINTPNKVLWYLLLMSVSGVYITVEREYFTGFLFYIQH